MSRRLADRELDRLLVELPRTAASPGFSRRVLAALDRPAPGSTNRRWLLTGAAAAAALALVVLLLPWPGDDPELADTRALREEHQLLMQELESLKASLQEARPAPVLYLGGNESVDLVLDLGPVWQTEAAGYQPAMFAGDDRPMPTAAPAGDRR